MCPPAHFTHWNYSNVFYFECQGHIYPAHSPTLSCAALLCQERSQDRRKICPCNKECFLAFLACPPCLTGSVLFTQIFAIQYRVGRTRAKIQRWITNCSVTTKLCNSPVTTKRTDVRTPCDFGFLFNGDVRGVACFFFQFLSSCTTDVLAPGGRKDQAGRSH